MNAAKTNHISLSFDAISENEAFARMTAAMFMAQLNPTLDDVEDVDRWKKTLELKNLFEKRIGGSVYTLLPGVLENSFSLEVTV